MASPPIFISKLDARCPSSAMFAVVDESNQIIACHSLKDDADRDASNRMSGYRVAAGLGVPQDIPTPTAAIGQAYSAPMQGGSVGGGAQPGAVLTPDQGGPSVSAGMDTTQGPGGWTTGYQPGAQFIGSGRPGPSQNTVYGAGGGAMGSGRGLALPDVETRRSGLSWPMQDLEIRSTRSGMRFDGYAAIFDEPSLPMGPAGRQFVETIRPGAFTRSLQTDRDIRMFLNHDPGKLLATRKAGTLELAEDRRGLHVGADLPDTTAGRDLAALLERRDVDSMSFTFKKVRDAWENAETRSLEEVKLFEVSPMTEWAAYPQTTASARSLRQTATRLITEGVKRAYSQSAQDAAQGASILSSLLYLLSAESDEPEQVAQIQSSIDALTSWLASERAEIDTPDDQTMGDAMMRRLPTNVARARLALLTRVPV
jgi:HK97 family phage prohead protease